MFKKAQKKTSVRKQKFKSQVVKKTAKKKAIWITLYSLYVFYLSHKNKSLIKLWIQALKNLEQLMDLVTKQERTYRYRLCFQSNFYQQHLMVKYFLLSQKKRLLDETRQNLVIFVATTFNRSQTTAQNIVCWEKS